MTFEFYKQKYVRKVFKLNLALYTKQESPHHTTVGDLQKR